MKLRIAVISLLLFLGLTGTATAYVAYPTIGESQAERDVIQFMHSKYPGWRHKRVGYVDCGHGRINRFTWSCAVGWVSGHANCWQGRARVENEETIEGVTYYLVTADMRRSC